MTLLKGFKIDGLTYKAENCVGGVLVNPVLPKLFDDTPNDSRSAAQLKKWWGRPFIRTMTVEEWDKFYAERTDEYAEAGRKHWADNRSEWMKEYPSGTRYETRCLDGGAWDRSTSWGMFPTLELALACSNTGPSYRLRTSSGGQQDIAGA